MMENLDKILQQAREEAQQGQQETVLLNSKAQEELAAIESDSNAMAAAIADMDENNDLQKGFEKALNDAGIPTTIYRDQGNAMEDIKNEIKGSAKDNTFLN